MTERKKLSKDIERRVKRMKKAEKERPTILAQTIFLGTLGLIFVLPVVAGAYLGRWIDSGLEGYSMRWTLSLLFLGVIVGAVNVYLLVRER
ncbi:ATP synthase protein I [Desulfopila aestuarii DSM 18488]|uniref:ATP synthase protein I n=2 Tax=Desulfopila aestuarii TaxID=231440 RepID=A0A1M7YAE5_9BACT|nr:AtpZ/AtpI family protein [Desulfopila aestuarii]SHO49612.1 ATP synthase protein I [Desulfopila aestuarii DSM 18488]